MIVSTLGSDAGNYAAVAAGTAASAIPVCGPACGALAAGVVKLIDAAAHCPDNVKIADPCNPPSMHWPCDYSDASKANMKKACVIQTELQRQGFKGLEAWARPCMQQSLADAQECARVGAEYHRAQEEHAKALRSRLTGRGVPLYKNPLVLGIGAAAILGAALLFR